MDKSSFEPHTIVTVTLRDAHGTPRPANLYVCRVHEGFLVARNRADGLLHRIAFDRIERIVESKTVPPAQRYVVPAPLLDAALWRDRTQMDVYASAPHLGH